MAVRIAWARKSPSARVASWAENSTASQWNRQADTSSPMSFSMAGAFRRQMYSICTVDTGSTTCSTGFFAARMLSHAASTDSAVNPTVAETSVEIMEAMVRFSRLSAFASSMRGSSMPSIFSLSSARTISSFSRKVSAPLCAEAMARMVAS